MPRRKGVPEDIDVIERVQAAEERDALHLALRDEVIYLRNEMAGLIRSLNRCEQQRLLALNHKLRRD